MLRRNGPRRRRPNRPRAGGRRRGAARGRARNRGSVAVGYLGPRMGRGRPPAITNVRRTAPGPTMVISNKVARRVAMGQVRRNRPARVKRDADGITINFKFRWLQAVFNSDNTTDFKTAVSNNSTGGQAYVAPGNSYYFPTMVYNQARNWQFMQVQKAQLMYTTRVGTNIAAMITCGYFRDPGYFEGIGKASSTTLVTEPDLMFSPCCMEFPVWKNMICQSFVGGRKLSIAGSTLTTAIPFTSSTATDRQTISGVFGLTMSGTNPTPDSGFIVGDIYLAITLRLTGMQTAITTGVSALAPLLLLEERALVQRKLQGETDEEEFLRLTRLLRETRISDEKDKPTLDSKSEIKSLDKLEIKSLDSEEDPSDELITLVQGRPHDLSIPGNLAYYERLLKRPRSGTPLPGRLERKSNSMK